MNLESCVAILAPGLLGGSLALAVRKKCPMSAIHVWARRPEVLDEVRRQIPSAEVSTSISDTVSKASIAILCMPVQHMRAAAQQIAASQVRKELVVTDVGSVKGAVVSELGPLLAAKGVAFIGSHPMAGSHATGMAHAREDLFDQAACLLTPVDSTPAPALERLRRFWSALGCRIIEMSPAAHDRAVARISHLPHAMAVLTTLAALKDDRDVLTCSAGGFRDTTRVASGDPSMWAGILRENRDEVRAALRDASDALFELQALLEEDDEEPLRRFLARAKEWRDMLPPPRFGPAKDQTTSQN